MVAIEIHKPKSLKSIFSSNLLLILLGDNQCTLSYFDKLHTSVLFSQAYQDDLFSLYAD